MGEELGVDPAKMMEFPDGGRGAIQWENVPEFVYVQFGPFFPSGIDSGAVRKDAITVCSRPRVSKNLRNLQRYGELFLAIMIWILGIYLAIKMLLLAKWILCCCPAESPVRKQEQVDP